MLESTRAMFGRGRSERTLVDPAVILRSTLAMVASSARIHGISTDLVVEGRPGSIAINALQFQQAMLNLFQNAIEALSHSDQRRRNLLVRCWDDQGVVIRVEDNGPGIAPADRKKIFDAFFTTRPEGLGMGLVIARSVIRAHGGRIEVEPRSPAGTAFIIHLPYGEQHPGGAAPG
jgi:signal transduction histidine kinase